MSFIEIIMFFQYPKTTDQIRRIPTSPTFILRFSSAVKAERAFSLLLIQWSAHLDTKEKSRCFLWKEQVEQDKLSGWFKTYIV